MHVSFSFHNCPCPNEFVGGGKVYNFTFNVLFKKQMVNLKTLQHKRESQSFYLTRSSYKLYEIKTPIFLEKHKEKQTFHVNSR